VCIGMSKEFSTHLTVYNLNVISRIFHILLSQDRKNKLNVRMSEVVWKVLLKAN
jgi:hypothetical protein